VEALLDRDLAQHPDLTVGQLDNGLRFVILPNSVPPNRFEAHLELHAGRLTQPRRCRS
jgi:predicted Zn-dependent peptidase